MTANPSPSAHKQPVSRVLAKKDLMVSQKKGKVRTKSGNGAGKENEKPNGSGPSAVSKENVQDIARMLKGLSKKDLLKSVMANLVPQNHPAEFSEIASESDGEASESDSEREQDSDSPSNAVTYTRAEKLLAEAESKKKDKTTTKSNGKKKRLSVESEETSKHEGAGVEREQEVSTQKDNLAEQRAGSSESSDELPLHDSESERDLSPSQVEEVRAEHRRLETEFQAWKAKEAEKAGDDDYEPDESDEESEDDRTSRKRRHKRKSSKSSGLQRDIVREEDGAARDGIKKQPPGNKIGDKQGQDNKATTNGITEQPTLGDKQGQDNKATADGIENQPTLGDKTGDKQGQDNGAAADGIENQPTLGDKTGDKQGQDNEAAADGIENQPTLGDKTGDKQGQDNGAAADGIENQPTLGDKTCDKQEQLLPSPLPPVQDNGVAADGIEDHPSPGAKTGDKQELHASEEGAELATEAEIAAARQAGREEAMRIARKKAAAMKQAAIEKLAQEKIIAAKKKKLLADIRKESRSAALRETQQTVACTKDENAPEAKVPGKAKASKAKLPPPPPRDSQPGRPERTTKGQNSKYGSDFEKPRLTGSRKRPADSESQAMAGHGLNPHSRVQMFVGETAVGTGLLAWSDPTDTIHGVPLGLGKVGVTFSTKEESVSGMTIPGSITRFQPQGGKLTVAGLPLHAQLDWLATAVRAAPKRIRKG